MIVKRGEAGLTLGGNEHLGTAKGRLTDDKIGIENPMSVRRANPVSNLRTSKYGPSGRQSGRMSSGVVSGRRDTLRVTRTGKRGSLDMLSNLVTKRDLPSGQVRVVDERSDELRWHEHLTFDMRHQSLHQRSSVISQRHEPIPFSFAIHFAPSQVLVDPLAEQAEKSNKREYHRRRSSLLRGQGSAANDVL